MEFKVKASSELTFRSISNNKQRLINVYTDLELDDIIEEEHFITNSNFNKDYYKTINACFIQALINNCFSAEHTGAWKEHEQMEYIIAELNRAFASPERKSLFYKNLIEK